MLLTNRLEQTGAAPLGFVANDYALACWSVHPPENVDDLFSEQLLGDNLQEWLDKSAMLRRTFREVALISGLVDRNLPGHEKSRRQMTMSTDRSGRMKSPIALPSRRNSGLDATSKSASGRVARMISAMRRLVPAGTVDFVTTTA